MPTLAADALTLMDRGGPVMWPLLALSILSLAMTLERAWFWATTHAPGWSTRADAVIKAIRLEKPDTNAQGLYASVIESAAALPPDETIAIELVERYRPRYERFSAAHAAITAGAPLLGILGTVLGIIKAFDLLGQGDAAQDITTVAAGIAEALITTGAGLVVALITLFPAMLFRAQASRCQSTIERIAAARAATQTNAHTDSTRTPTAQTTPKA